MKYIMTIFWSVLVGAAVSYVLSSMAGHEFNVPATLALAGTFAIIIFVCGGLVLKPEKNK